MITVALAAEVLWTARSSLLVLHVPFGDDTALGAGMRPARLLARINRGEVSNVHFGDLARLVEALGFVLHRQRGSHQVYVHTGIGEVLVLQPDASGDAKPYQVRQLRRFAEQYALSLED